MGPSCSFFSLLILVPINCRIDLDQIRRVGSLGSWDFTILILSQNTQKSTLTGPMVLALRGSIPTFVFLTYYLSILSFLHSSAKTHDAHHPRVARRHLFFNFDAGVPLKTQIIYVHISLSYTFSEAYIFKFLYVVQSLSEPIALLCWL